MAEAGEGQPGRRKLPFLEESKVVCAQACHLVQSPQQCARYDSEVPGGLLSFDLHRRTQASGRGQVILQLEVD